MLENVYEGLNARSEVYFSKQYFSEMYPTCVSSKLCEFIQAPTGNFLCITIRKYLCLLVSHTSEPGRVPRRQTSSLGLLFERLPNQPVSVHAGWLYKCAIAPASAK